MVQESVKTARKAAVTSRVPIGRSATGKCFCQQLHPLDDSAAASQECQWHFLHLNSRLAYRSAQETAIRTMGDQLKRLQLAAIPTVATLVSRTEAVWRTFNSAQGTLPMRTGAPPFPLDSRGAPRPLADVTERLTLQDYGNSSLMHVLQRCGEYRICNAIRHLTRLKNIASPMQGGSIRSRTPRAFSSRGTGWLTGQVCRDRFEHLIKDGLATTKDYGRHCQVRGYRNWNQTGLEFCGSEVEQRVLV